MPRLVCRFCGFIHTDPGGDPKQYRCSRCYSQGLERVLTKQEKVLATGVAGATLGGLAFGPAGAIVGGLIGLVFGDQQFKDKEQQAK